MRYFRLGMFLVWAMYLNLNAICIGQNTRVNTFQYHLDKASFIAINGYSNTTDFTCYCKQDNILSNKISVTQSANSMLWWFYQAKLELPAKAIDCGNPGINMDMRKTLQVNKYPHITIELVSFSSHEIIEISKRPKQGTAEAFITIAGTRRAEKIQVSFQQTHAGRMVVTGNHKLYFTNYKIEPPTAVMGLVKVLDGFDLKFQLIIAY